MRNYTIEHEGVVYAEMTAAAINAAGVPQDVVDAHIQTLTDREVVRGQINTTVGDVETLLGTTADSSAFGFLVSAALISAVSSSSDFAGFKAAFLDKIAGISGSADVEALANNLLQSIADQSISVPLMDKGLDAVFSDVSERNTAVSAAMTTAQT